MASLLLLAFITLVEVVISMVLCDESNVGLPPREFELLFDTGSDVTWTRYRSCVGCPRSVDGVPFTAYDRGSSWTAGTIGCSHQLCIGLCYRHSNQCTYNITYRDGDEVVGRCIISQLSSRGLAPNIFSHCLRKDGNGGGVLALGEIIDPRMVYNPLVPAMNYNVHLQSIAVNGKMLPIDPTIFSTSHNRGTLVDSRTVLTYAARVNFERCYV
ncbi:hypothetical protein ACFX15_000720 [Malus domestica]